MKRMVTREMLERASPKQGAFVEAARALLRKPTLKEQRLSELRRIRSQRDMQAFSVRRFLAGCTPEQLGQLVAEFGE